MATKQLLVFNCLIFVYLFGGATPARAEALNYDYVYFSHAETDNNGQSSESDAYGGYWEFTKTLHLLASYGDASLYTGNLPGDDNTAFRLGVGGHFLLGEDTMIAPELALVRAEYQTPMRMGPNPPPIGYGNQGYDNQRSDTGYAAIVDLRHRVRPWLEILGSVRYTRVFDNGNTNFIVGPVFHLNKYIALGALYQSRDGDTGWELTVRFYY